jgi:mRNA interferase MazF
LVNSIHRGDIWTISGGWDYGGKPRPAVIIQDDRFSSTASIAVCPFTTIEIDVPLMRLRIEPGDRNGLREPSYTMVDKLTTIPKTKLGARIGSLSDREMLQLNRAIVVFLGIAA